MRIHYPSSKGSPKAGSPLTSSHSRRLQGRRRGSALVEFALVLVVLVAIVMGVIEFSVYGKNALTIANAAREGARAAAVGRTTSEIKDRVKKSARPLSVESPKGSITIEFSTNGGSTFATLGDNTAGTENAAAPDNLIRVRVKSVNSSVTKFFGPLFDRDLQTEVIMRRER